MFITDRAENRIVSPEELLEIANDRIELGEVESLQEASWALRALANDRDFVLREYHTELKRYVDGASPNLQSPQSVTFASDTDFYVRANIWLPLSESGNMLSSEQRLYSYELAHDHNFDFATVGYFGPGYETSLYRYDVNDVDGCFGEAVDLEDAGREKLHPGRVMIYEAGRDVHVQHTPTDVSISLNLMCRNPTMLTHPQYLFDVSSKKIVHAAGDLTSTRMFLLDLFRYMYDHETVGILGDVTRRHQSERTRAYALKVLDQIDPTEAERCRSYLPPHIARLSMSDMVFGSGSRDFN